MKAITFHNFTDQPFSWTWDKVVYSFKAHEKYLMEDWKAHHFAKHLANHVLNTLNKSVADPMRDEILAKALPEDAPEINAEDTSKLETELLNKTGAVQPLEKKKGRPKKDVKTDEETFEGLKS